uniref:Laminin subunit gamma 2 n=1 Tax=Sander lucioperca TaxID=283035 RepID=A0A8D0APG7_SANLU
RYCLRDAVGLHCVDCQGNTEGRHCERCKAGFYLAGAPLSCTPCLCNPTGSVAATCDSRGRCSCKEGITGEKCDRCPDGPIGPDGCSQSRSCFCYGHSSQCSAQSGYSVHSITSTFADGPDGWKAATDQGVTPNDVHFRWSPSHQDLEVISKNSLPVYLYAPAPYLGNQLLSFGQNFSFSLRLDRGVRHPSTNDVILEGGGLRVSASLGELRSIVPCGQKISYSFRLDEGPGSRWRPQLSSTQFQTLLQNLTAIKIRATFGQDGRGYLDNVQLVSARRGGAGVPASWVQTCRCPPGYEGEFCERCSAGFRRRTPADGAFSVCERCSCRGGSCDPQTGDCYSGDETPGEPSCAEGFYRDPWQPRSCVKCPCPDGESCSIAAGSLEPRCDRCPTGATGPRCDVCQEGYHGNPSGSGGVQRPCRPCRCNGHIDVRVAGSCDRRSGECLKCRNNTAGRSCEECQPGFYHGHAADACKPCGCDVLGSESRQCDDAGRCRCRPGFEGLKCQRSNCPACFSPIKKKAYAAKLKELEILFSDMDGGLKPADSAEMEAALRATEELVDDLQYEAEMLTGSEKNLQGRLASISRSQLAEEQDIQNIADTADAIKRRQQTYRAKVAEVQSLMEEMRRDLNEAKAQLRLAVRPDRQRDRQRDRERARQSDRQTECDSSWSSSAGFDQQIDGGKALADAAIKRLPGISTVIQRAVDSNAETISVLGDVSGDYDAALGTINVLENLVNGLEGTIGSLPSHADLLKDATKLNNDAKALKTAAMDTAADLASELDAGKTLKTNAEQVKDPFHNVVTQTDVTLQQYVVKPSVFFFFSDQNGGTVDEKQLKQLEDSVAGAQRDVEGRLRPRLQDMEAQEAAHRRRLATMDQDITMILADIANLEDILRAIPSGCFNSPPIEEA